MSAPCVRRLRNLAHRSILVLLLALGTMGATAQVVNIEGRRFMNDTVPWSGFVDLRFNVAENTQRSSNFGLGGAVQHVRGKHRWFFINDLTLNRVEANAFQNTGFQHLRYNYARDRMWTGEAFVQTQYNKPLALDFRLTIGAGPRLRLVNEGSYKVHIGTALMFEQESITNGPSFGAGRSSSYLSATANFTPVVGLSTVLYYQPRLFDASDHRVALETGLLLRFAERFTFESRLNLLKDTGQPVGIPQLSYTWNNRFGFRF